MLERLYHKQVSENRDLVSKVESDVKLVRKLLESSVEKEIHLLQGKVAQLETSKIQQDKTNESICYLGLKSEKVDGILDQLQKVDRRFEQFEEQLISFKLKQDIVTTIHVP